MISECSADDFIQRSASFTESSRRGAKTQRDDAAYKDIQLFQKYRETKTLHPLRLCVSAREISNALCVLRAFSVISAVKKTEIYLEVCKRQFISKISR